MATYSEWEQRMLDQKSGQEMDGHATTPQETVGLYECDCCGAMVPYLREVWVFGIETYACEECLDGE
jgi:hypothetical protein